jgi:hypothetical protein
LHSGLPPHVLLVLDAAYAEYVRRNDYEAGIELVATSENVVMLRTFSKIYGLAALRLGWLYGPAHVVDAVNRIRGPFNVNAAAQAAGIAAMKQCAFAMTGPPSVYCVWNAEGELVRDDAALDEDPGFARGFFRQFVIPNIVLRWRDYRNNSRHRRKIKPVHATPLDLRALELYEGQECKPRRF